MNVYRPGPPSVRLARIVPDLSRIAGDERRPGRIRRRAANQPGTTVPKEGDAMSVSPISSSTLAASVTQSMQSKLQQFRQEFQQLGSDLQTGNLSASQQDASALPGLASQSSSTSPTASSDPIAQAFNQLAQDLQSGNISGAQQDYGNLKQDQKVDQGHDNLRHHEQGFSVGSGQTLTQWGQAPPSANASNAQTAYNSLFQEVQQIGSGESLTPALQAASSSSDSVSFSA
jgi:hypothetical protein